MAGKARTRDSVRFDPYFKVQFWVARNYAWQDVQERHLDEALARAAAQAAAATLGTRCRLMRITMEGRAPLPDSEVSP